MTKPDPISGEFDTFIAAIWEEASDDQMQDALIQVSMDIDRRFNFRGEKLGDSQSREWPRANSIYDNGNPIEDVPQEVKDATSFYAACVAAGYTLQHPKVLARLLLILEPVLDPDEPFRGNLRPL